jgi:trigger factor
VRGLKAGESKVFSLAFPADYGGKDVAGKTAEFTITVKEVAEPILPELDAEFAKALGQPEGDVEKLLTDIRANIEREVKARTMARTKNSVMDALVAVATFDVPKALIDSECEARARLSLGGTGYTGFLSLCHSGRTIIRTDEILVNLNRPEGH